MLAGIAPLTDLCLHASCTDVWAMEKGFDMASINVLGPVPTLEESSVITTQAAKALPLSPLGVGRASGKIRAEFHGLVHRADNYQNFCPSRT